MTRFLASSLGAYAVAISDSGLDVDEEIAAVPKIEQLGYGTIWLLNIGESRLRVLEEALARTSSVRIGSGIVNIWATPARAAAAFYHDAQQRHPDRFVLGVGLGHRERDKAFQKPYDATVAYLDELAAAGVPKERIVLAALRPRMLRLAAERTAGGFPWLQPVAQTRLARETLGPEPFLTTGHHVAFEEDPAKAKQALRETVTFYNGLVNYVNAWQDFGFPGAQAGGTPSDELLDALTSHGSPAQIAAGLRAHLEAGADQVVIQAVPGSGGQRSLPGLTALAKELGLS